MDRAAEVEVLASTLEEPSKALVRAALVAMKQGRLDAAARVMLDQVQKHRGRASWTALLFALEHAELRLAGSVAFVTPQVRYAASNTFPMFEERWGPIEVRVFPGGYTAFVELVDEGSGLVLRPMPKSREAISIAPIREALAVLLASLRAHLGRVAAG